jgi:hypothetical protein
VKCFKLNLESKENDIFSIAAFKTDKERNEAIGDEEFMISHCSFPGSTDNINLATLLLIGNEANS